MGDPNKPQWSKPLYYVGDSVKVWPIYKTPTGTVIQVLDQDAPPYRYEVTYTYETGTVYTEKFDSDDLTLVKKANTWSTLCECGSTTQMHDKWCPKDAMTRGPK